MTKLAEIQQAIQQLAPQEQQELRLWLDETVVETPAAMLAAIDEGLHSLQAKGAQPITRAQLETRVRQWSGVLN